METTHSFDETPTPTRFMRNCEDIGLFQELQLNPFDETFRIAVESSSSDLASVLRESVAKPVAEETLNTPKIIAITKSDTFQHIYNIMEEDDSDDFIISPDHFLVESVGPESSSKEKDNHTSEDSEEVEIIEEPVQQNGFATHIKVTPPTTVNAIVSALTSNSSANTITYTINGDAIREGRIGNFIIQTAPSISSNNGNNNGNKSLHNQPLVLPKTVIATTKDASKETPKFIASNVIEGVTVKSSDFVYQLSNTKLPTVSGKNVVILPSRNYAATTKPSTSQQPIRAAVRSEERTLQRLDVGCDVKEKLRNLIEANSSQFIDGPIPREGRKRSMTESGSTSIPAVDEKREYSRERNRMAQKRCRMKKKRWLMQMKKDTEVVLNENQVLQDEVGNLRAEVAHLKTLLLAHRNCSVTRAMFKADLSAILNNDISDIAENVEIPVPDSTNDCDEPATKINYSSIVSHRQVNQVNHHVNHIHVHVPPSPQCGGEEAAACARSKSGGAYEIRPLTQTTRKLIFDSKVVPIKPDDRSASVLHKQISSSSSSSSTADSGRDCLDDSKPMQSTEVSASTQWFRRLVFEPAANSHH